MAPKKARSKPNADVTVQDYKSSLAVWLLAPPIKNFEDRLGPTWIADARQVSPHSMTRLSPLILDLINCGCPLVINGSRFEQAVSQSIGEHSHVFASKGADLELLPNRLTNHVMAHLCMLRNILSEDEGAMSSSGRRYQKTGGFRRLCTANQWVMLQPLFAAGRHEVAPQAVPGAVDTMESIELDEHGWPTIFSKVVGEQESPEQRECNLAFPSVVAETASLAETALYDEDGFPVVPGNTTDFFDKAFTKQDVLTEPLPVDIQPVTPKRGGRKRALLASRMSAKKSSQMSSRVWRRCFSRMVECLETR